VNKTQRSDDWSSNNQQAASAPAPVAREDFGPDEAPF
jgi:hypothetical protein